MTSMRAVADAVLPGTNVLVVDDVEPNRSVLCRRLSKLGYSVNAAESGMSALTLIEAQCPDIMLLDYMMPGMNGIDVLRELRSNGHYADLPVIMLTARTEAGTVVAALEAGADDYVSKPIDFNVLAARIEAQLQRRKHASALRRANAALDERVTRRAMELTDLQVQLETEVARSRALQVQVDRMQADRTAVFGSSSSRVAPQLRRIAQIADGLIDGPHQHLPNPAALAEISALARSALGIVEAR